MPLQKSKIDNFLKNNSYVKKTPSTAIYAISAKFDKISIGGNQTNYVKNKRNYLINLNIDGSLDEAFCINGIDSKFNASVQSVEIDDNEKILAVGAFTDFGGTTNRNRIVRFNSNGTLDTTFCTNAVDGNKFNALLNNLVLQSDGKILVGGTFTNYAGTTGRNKLVRLNSDGTLDTSFCNNAVDSTKFNGDIYSIYVQSDGKILIGGDFTAYAGTTNRNRLVRLNSDGTLDTSFCTNASDGNKINSTIRALSVQSDGKILVGGFFTSYAGTTNRNKLIRLNSDGTLDSAFCVNASDGSKINFSVYNIKIQSNQKILFSGDFSSYGTANRNGLVRLNSDGTVDTAFCANASDNTKFSSSPYIYALALQSDGKILVGGLFLSYAGITNRNHLIRLNSDGTLDTTFCNNAVDTEIFSNTITTSGGVLLIDSSNKLLVGGNFINFKNVTTRNYLIKFNIDGTVDTTFCTNAVDLSKFNAYISALEKQSNGDILIGGNFTNYGSVAGRTRLLRVSSSGILDTAFCANAVDGKNINFAVRSIKVQSDGKILIGGEFITYGGTTGRNLLLRLNADGTLDTPFCTNAVDGNKFGSIAINSVALQSDSKILVGGNFTSYAGTTNRNRLVRLNSDGTLDSTFCINASDSNKFGASINSIQIQSDGKILAGGAFTAYAGTANRNYLIRLNSDGTLDTTFCTNASDGAKFNALISTIEVQSDGKIIITGNFTNYNGITGRDRVLRLNSDGTLDTSFCNNGVDNSKFTTNAICSITNSNAEVYILGGFTYSGIGLDLKRSSSGLIRLNKNGRAI